MTLINVNYSNIQYKWNHTTLKQIIIAYYCPKFKCLNEWLNVIKIKRFWKAVTNHSSNGFDYSYYTPHNYKPYKEKTYTCENRSVILLPIVWPLFPLFRTFSYTHCNYRYSPIFQVMTAQQLFVYTLFCLSSFVEVD